jgi:hypothetical protein
MRPQVGDEITLIRAVSYFLDRAQADLTVPLLQRGMLTQLAARLRERQANGEGGFDVDGATIVLDDNCTVSSSSQEPGSIVHF